jgi:hexokinase
MKINEIVQALQLDVITGHDLLEREIKGVYVGDLLSVVMGNAEEHQVWITVQSHINIIAVASLINLGCIIVSEGFDIDEDAVKKGLRKILYY